MRCENPILIYVLTIILVSHLLFDTSSLNNWFIVHCSKSIFHSKQIWQAIIITRGFFILWKDANCEKIIKISGKMCRKSDFSWFFTKIFISDIKVIKCLSTVYNLRFFIVSMYKEEWLCGRALLLYTRGHKFEPRLRF